MDVYRIVYVPVKKSCGYFYEIEVKAIAVDE